MIHFQPATRAEDEMTDTNARLWHPWLRINRILRVMLERGGVVAGRSRVHEGARVKESGPARGVVQTDVGFWACADLR
jgi:hypothetical protein